MADFQKYNKPTLSQEPAATPTRLQAEQATSLEQKASNNIDLSNATITTNKSTLTGANNSMKNFTTAALSGLGQVVFSDKPVVGAMFLAGLFISSPLVAAASVVGLVVSTLTAKLLKLDKSNVQSGIYGFNAALVSIASFTLFAPGIFSGIALLAGSACSVLIMNSLNKAGIKPRTAPFILSTWGMLAISSWLGVSGSSATATSLFSGLNNFLADPSGILSSFSQIMLQNSPATGLLFVTGLLLTSVRQGVFAVAGGVAGIAVATMFGASDVAIASGLWGYNAILSAAAFSDLKKSTLAVGCSLLLDFGFLSAGIPALTAPFVLATWATDYVYSKFVSGSQK